LIRGEFDFTGGNEPCAFEFNSDVYEVFFDGLITVVKICRWGWIDFEWL